MTRIDDEPKLLFERSLGGSSLPGTGQPTGVFPGRDSRLVAVVSAFGPLQWPGRSISYPLRDRQRLTLYEGNPPRRVAVLDTASHQINDVAIHPTRPLVAVATGEYDGGFLFEGELLLWDWERGTVTSRLRPDRAVVRCRFDRGGSQLRLLVSPAWEDEFPGPFETYLGCSLALGSSGKATRDTDPPLDRLVPGTASEFGFDAGWPPWEPQGWVERLRQVAASAGFELRYGVWEVAWLGEGRVAAVHECCRLEVWETSGRRLLHRTGAGLSVQILLPSETEPGFIHVVHGVRQDSGGQVYSELVPFDPVRLTLGKAHPFPSGYAFFVTPGGWLLGRRTANSTYFRRPSRQYDVLLRPDGRVKRRLDLGNYDLFNHHLRIDGGDRLYFLQGTPPSSHLRKNVCELNPATAEWRVLWPLAPSRLRRKHLMECTGCRLDDGDLVLGASLHGAQPAGSGFINRRRIRSGREVWRHPVEAQVTALAFLPDRNAVAFALANGELGLLDAATGRVLDRLTASADGVDTVVMSLAYRLTRLAAGTIDGRILLYCVGP